jgi:hypothetical protein
MNQKIKSTYPGGAEAGYSSEWLAAGKAGVEMATTIKLERRWTWSLGTDTVLGDVRGSGVFGGDGYRCGMRWTPKTPDPDCCHFVGVGCLGLRMGCIKSRQNK